MDTGTVGSFEQPQPAKLPALPEWSPDPRPAAPELAEGYRAEPFDPSVPFEHDHITSWAKFGDLLGPEGVKRLMRAVQ